MKSSKDVGVNTEELLYIEYLKKKYGLIEKKIARKRIKQVPISPLSTEIFRNSPHRISCLNSLFRMERTPLSEKKIIPYHLSEEKKMEIFPKDVLKDKSILLKPFRFNSNQENVFEMFEREKQNEKKKVRKNEKKMEYSQAIRIKNDGDNEDDDEKQINQYVFTKVLGKGGYAEVKLCYNEKTKEHYAVKIIDKAHLEKQMKKQRILKPGGGRGRFAMMRGRGRGRGRGRMGPPVPPPKPKNEPSNEILREVAILKKIDHPNVVKLYEVIDDSRRQKYYLIYELIKHGNVITIDSNNEADRPGYGDTPKLKKYFRHLIMAVDYLHENNITHKDIKPENLLINENDILKVTDFGISKIHEDDSDDQIECKGGTQAFVSPEACKGGTCSGRGYDIWTCGVTLYCMCFGKFPFYPKRGMPFILIYNMIKHNDPNYKEGGIEISDGLLDLMQKLLKKDPNERITMEEIKVHPWLTDNGKFTFPDVKKQKIKLDKDDLEGAIVKGEELALKNRFVILQKIGIRMREHIKAAKVFIKRREEGTAFVDKFRILDDDILASSMTKQGDLFVEGSEEDSKKLEEYFEMQVL